MPFEKSVDGRAVPLPDAVEQHERWLRIVTSRLSRSVCGLGRGGGCDGVGCVGCAGRARHDGCRWILSFTLHRTKVSLRRVVDTGENGCQVLFQPALAGRKKSALRQAVIF